MFKTFPVMALKNNQYVVCSTYNLDVVIVERSRYDPFEELLAEESVREGAASPREAKRPPEDSPYRVIWSVLRSILEIIIDVVI